MTTRREFLRSALRDPLRIKPEVRYDSPWYDLFYPPCTGPGPTAEAIATLLSEKTAKLPDPFESRWLYDQLRGVR